MSAFKIRWRDSFREPKCSPNPAYPDGIDVDASGGAAQCCKADLPYPAKRCGFYLIDCLCCGYRIAVTTAGRPDDPRSVKIPCKTIVMYGRVN